jgi:hypothetical protein
MSELAVFCLGCIIGLLFCQLANDVFKKKQRFRFLGTKQVKWSIPVNKDDPSLGKAIADITVYYARNADHVQYYMGDTSFAAHILLPTELRKADDKTVMEFVINKYTPLVDNDINESRQPS